MKNYHRSLCGLLALGFSLLTHSLMAQCGDRSIQSFEVTQVEHTTGGASNGAITVRIVGGQAPFVYTLLADRGGRGKAVVSTSAPTRESTFTFRKVTASARANVLGYVVEVQSSQATEGNLPEAICRKRAIFNLEVK